MNNNRNQHSSNNHNLSQSSRPMPIPSYFDQSSDIWAAAQHHREMHPPQLYQQFDGNWERFQQFQQEQLTKFQERQLQMRQLFIQQYQVAVEQQQQFPAAPQLQHDELSDNMFEAVVDEQQHHQDQD
ncbi:hypothetical protein TSUD_198620 [Trifolium subterraneum]|uniref:Uncharacterized protein n=1 Tax=Trifolium subterraneum TaxID=3900 RepID=A0A2Z6M2Q7_TRISU|nr:hypothetical protein TSUD_198620 [Trifolium subterraneum]